MFGKQRSYRLEDVCEGYEVFVEQAAPLHQVQANRQAHQPEERDIPHLCHKVISLPAEMPIGDVVDKEFRKFVGANEN